ncbi:MAG TPA: hypothetical protein VMW57_05255 [Methyloceanibacter sp.]|nr:hypothetical protein [Methyloceanibacter sp.]
MAKTLKIATMACVAAGALAAAGLLVSDGQFGGNAGHASAVTLAVALPHAVPGAAPAVDLSPSLPKAPPLPQRVPSVAPMDMAKMDKTAKSLANAAEIVVAAKPVAVRAGPSQAAPMLYGFPAGRELREIGRDGDYIQVADVESGAHGWIEKTALASNLLTASIGTKTAKPVRQAAAEIDTPEPVTAIPEKEKYHPMLLGGGSDRNARSSGSKTNFAGFLSRAFR